MSGSLLSEGCIGRELAKVQGSVSQKASYVGKIVGGHGANKRRCFRASGPDFGMESGMSDISEQTNTLNDENYLKRCPRKRSKPTAKRAGTSRMSVEGSGTEL